MNVVDDLIFVIKDMIETYNFVIKSKFVIFYLEFNRINKTFESSKTTPTKLNGKLSLICLKVLIIVNCFLFVACKGKLKIKDTISNYFQNNFLYSKCFAIRNFFLNQKHFNCEAEALKKITSCIFFIKQCLSKAFQNSKM